MEEKRSSAAPIAIIVLATMTLLYVGSYFALVKAEPLWFMSGVGPWIKRDVYRLGGDFSKHFYFPINWVDRRIRPKYWHYDIDVERPGWRQGVQSEE
jgi:hypothetical protein